MDAKSLELTAHVVGAFVSNNSVAANDLPALIQAAHAALTGATTAVAEPEPRAPAVSIRKAIRPDAITCLECGREFKTLKRHLRTDHDLDPTAYRAKWGLPRNFPMVAPAYAQARSDLAKNMGLGQGGRKPPAAAKGRKARAPKGATSDS